MMIGRQRPKSDKLGLGYSASSCKVRVSFYVRVTFEYDMEEQSKVSNAKKALGPRKISRDGISRESFMSKVENHSFWISRENCLGY